MICQRQHTTNVNFISFQIIHKVQGWEIIANTLTSMVQLPVGIARSLPPRHHSGATFAAMTREILRNM